MLGQFSPVNLYTWVPVVSQPASPHHDVNPRRLGLAPSWRSLKDWSRQRQRHFVAAGSELEQFYLAIFHTRVVAATTRGRNWVLILNLQYF